jgi:hypothetical protein
MSAFLRKGVAFRGGRSTQHRRLGCGWIKELEAAILGVAGVEENVGLVQLDNGPLRVLSSRSRPSSAEPGRGRARTEQGRRLSCRWRPLTSHGMVTASHILRQEPGFAGPTEVPLDSAWAVWLGANATAQLPERIVANVGLSEVDHPTAAPVRRPDVETDCQALETGGLTWAFIGAGDENRTRIFSLGS